MAPASLAPDAGAQGRSALPRGPLGRGSIRGRRGSLGAFPGPDAYVEPVEPVEPAHGPEAFAYRIAEAFSDEAAAPLLCSGIIGYRALRRAGEELLRPATALGVRPRVTAYEFAQADQALGDLAEGRLSGAAVPRVDSA